MSVVALVFGEYFSHLTLGHASNLWFSKGVGALLISMVLTVEISNVIYITRVIKIITDKQMNVILVLYFYRIRPIKNCLFYTNSSPSLVVLGIFNVVGVQAITKLLSVASMLKLAVVGFLISCGITVLIKGQG